MQRADPSWIQEALRRHESALLSFAARLTGDLEAARDVVQDTFVKLCAERREAVEPHLAEWLFTVCRNGALDVRRRSRKAATEGGDMDLHVGAADGVAELETRDASARALELLARLPEAQQEVLRLRFHGGLSYKEIARVTGQSIGNVGWLIHVGLKALRAQLTGGAVEGTVV